MQIDYEELNRAIAVVADVILQMADEFIEFMNAAYEIAEQEYEANVPPEFKRVHAKYNLKHAYIQSQILDRKPRCIRVRTSC